MIHLDPNNHRHSPIENQMLTQDWRFENVDQYVFCRQTLFANCYELIRTFNTLLTRPTQLQLVPGEKSLECYTPRKLDAPITPFTVMDVTHMGKIVQEETLRTQREIGEYTRRVRAFEEAERKKRDDKERREREIRETKDAFAREERESSSMMRKEERLAEQTAVMDRQLSEPKPGESKEEAVSDINEDSD